MVNFEYYLIIKNRELCNTMLLFEEYGEKTTINAIRRAINERLGGIGLPIEVIERQFHLTDGAANMRVQRKG